MVTGVALAVALAIPIGLLLYKRDRERDVAAVLADRGFAAAPCEVHGAIVERPSTETCYQGTLGGVDAVVVFAERYRPGYVPNTNQVALDSYFGVLLDIAPPAGWLERWRGADVFRVVEVSPGRVLVAWTGPATGQELENRLDHVADAVGKIEGGNGVE